MSADPSTRPTPDAVILPRSVGDGPVRSLVDPNIDRCNRISDVSDPILGVDFAAGERSHIKTLPSRPNAYFIVKDVDAKLTGPDGAPRYCWVAKGGGVEYGYLHDHDQ